MKSGSRSMSKSPFQRLDDEGQHVMYSKEAVASRQNKQQNPTITVNSTEYASSADGNLSVDEPGRTRTNSHGQEQYGKGFV